MFNIGTIGTNETTDMLHNLCNKIELCLNGLSCNSSTWIFDSSKKTQMKSLGMVSNLSFIISADFDKLIFLSPSLTFIVGIH